VQIMNPQDAIEHSLGWVTEDRKKEGLVLSQSVVENISLASLEQQINRGGFLKHIQELEIAERYIRELGIRTPTPTQKTEYLSGGNQQKVVLAKWLNTAPDVIIMSEPTRGIDVGAKVDIYEIINQLTKLGKAVLLISSDLPELLGMSDRLVVMYDGEIRATLDTTQTTQEQVMYFATGGKQDEKTVSA
ncbi:MAG: sugar ABC transporter ATP-binding protein, partial [Firmicutes bacterium]|nr:sugar ABC transporter ATP-binding protein [Bacillota bacterium]